MDSYEIIRSKRKTMSIQVGRDARVIVRVPMRVSQKQIEAFVNAHEAWIKKHLEQAKQELERKNSFQFLDGQVVYFMGEKRKICTNCYITDMQLIRDNLLISDEITSDARSKAIIQFLREEARAFLKERVAFFSPMLGVVPQAVTVTGARTRWGSCSGKNRLSFSYRLVCLPPHLIDYVVVHELAHILEHNHSARFYAQIGRVLPDYTERIKELKAFQKLLTF